MGLEPIWVSHDERPGVTDIYVNTGEQMEMVARLVVPPPESEMNGSFDIYFSLYGK